MDQWKVLRLNHEPLISIIINNYNYGRFLPAAIESALHQSYPAVEVIVVDDGSTDHSRAIIAGYGARVVPVLKANGGQASAFNAGFAQSHGDVIIFLDADDVLLPQTAQRVAAVFEANPDAAKVQYRMAVIDAAGALTGKIKPAAHLPLVSGDLRRQVLTFPFDMTWMATSGNAFKAEVLHQIFPMPEADFRILADYYLAHLTPLFGQVIFLDEVGAYYRVHQANHYELATATLNLAQIRQTILYAQRTHRYIQQFAAQLGLEQAHVERSVSWIANRLISKKLAPSEHPIATDRVVHLWWLGIDAARRRFDVAWPMRLLFMAWFTAMVVAPLTLTYCLAEKFFFPEKRRPINPLLQLWKTSLWKTSHWNAP